MPPAPLACRVVIIDDDESVGKTMAGILKRSGYDAVCARSGNAGLDELRAALSFPLRAALIDIRLPDINGLQVLHEGRAVDPDLDAIMMTGHADTDTAIRALNTGAFGYLQKPCNIDELKALLSRLRERQELKLQNRELLSKLREANADLELKVEDRTADLRLFVDMVTHELRTPMTVIEGYTEVLIEETRGLKLANLLKSLEIIQKDAKRLSRLIKNMLDLAHIKNKGVALNPGPVDVKQLAQSVAQGLSVTRPDMKFEVEAEDGASQIESDKDCVEQILINLLSNAVKYSPPNSVVRVKIGSREDKTVVSVVDSGPGIPDDLREKVFEAFFRTQDAINRKTPGTGLGLTITKALVGALGGEIRVDPAASGAGSSFTFTLPKKNSPAS